MPKKVRPYGSGVDAESAALSRGRRETGEELVSELARALTAREIADQAAEAIRALSEVTSGDGTGFVRPDDVHEVVKSLERLGQHLPHLYEQLARILVVQREDGHIGEDPGQVTDFWIVEVVEALASAGQAADMMTAALSQTSKTTAELEAGVNGGGTNSRYDK